MREKFFVLFLAIFSTNFFSCNASIEEVCKEEFTDFQSEVTQIATALKVPITSDRMLASIAPQTSAIAVPVNLNSSFREKWQKWARQSIAQTENAMDIVAENPDQLAAKESLSEVVNELILFYSFTGAWDLTEMANSLQRVQLATLSAHSELCKDPVSQ